MTAALHSIGKVNVFTADEIIGRSSNATMAMGEQTLAQLESKPV